MTLLFHASGKASSMGRHMGHERFVRRASNSMLYSEVEIAVWMMAFSVKLLYPWGSARSNPMLMNPKTARSAPTPEAANAADAVVWAPTLMESWAATLVAIDVASLELTFAPILVTSFLVMVFANDSIKASATAVAAINESSTATVSAMLVFFDSRRTQHPSVRVYALSHTPSMGSTRHGKASATSGVSAGISFVGDGSVVTRLSDSSADSAATGASVGEPLDGTVSFGAWAVSRVSKKTSVSMRSVFSRVCMRDLLSRGRSCVFLVSANTSSSSSSTHSEAGVAAHASKQSTK